jgi:hypothetical protein
MVRSIVGFALPWIREGNPFEFSLSHQDQQRLPQSHGMRQDQARIRLKFTNYLLLQINLVT